MTAHLIARKRLLTALLAVSLLAGLAAGYLNGIRNADRLQIAAGTTHVMVDLPRPGLTERKMDLQDFDAATRRTESFGRIMTSNVVRERIARKLGVPVDDVATFARTTGAVPRMLTEPDLEERAVQIADSRRPYRLEVQARSTGPILGLYAQAPSYARVQELAQAAIAALDEYVQERAREQRLAPADTARVRQLGEVHGGVINSKIPVVIAVLSFMVVGGLVFLLGLGLISLRLERIGVLTDRPAETWTDNWPRTNRLLPWTVALFIAVLWLLPFNEIRLGMSTPIDVNLDRLVLPFVFAVWVLAFAAGRHMAPRMRMTGIHLAVIGFVGCAFLSVVVDAHYLNQTLELDQSFKRLPLLVTYVSLFFIAASSIRPGEVRAFMTYTFWLGVVCAAGIIWEYRLQYNVFYGLSDMVLPGIFEVAATDAGAGVDNIGRRVVRGPAAVPLEAVAMLSMALPIGLVWLMQAKTWGRRVLYGLAICLILAAIMATFRKSAILVPLSAVAALAYFRRRELLRLAPLGLVLLVVIHFVSPGALGSTTQQFDSSRLDVGTVNDRAVDYDAIRPELWTHFLLGKGWGTYDHVNYRVLDTEILQRVIEMGAIGVTLFVLMGVAVVLCARRTINERDADRAPLALVGAGAAVAFMVAATLFDILSFPHATYIFLYMSGLVAVAIGPRPSERRRRVRRRVHTAISPPVPASTGKPDLQLVES